MSPKDVMDFSLELFAGGLEDQKLAAVPAGQLLILPHFLLLLLPRRIDVLIDFRHQVVVETDHPEQRVFERERLGNDSLFLQE